MDKVPVPSGAAAEGLGNPSRMREIETASGVGARRRSASSFFPFFSDQMESNLGCRTRVGCLPSVE